MQLLGKFSKNQLLPNDSEMSARDTKYNFDGSDSSAAVSSQFLLYIHHKCNCRAKSQCCNSFLADFLCWFLRVAHFSFITSSVHMHFNDQDNFVIVSIKEYLKEILKSNHHLILFIYLAQYPCYLLPVYSVQNITCKKRSVQKKYKYRKC